MTRKIAVAVIHGMGSQGQGRQGSDNLSFSSDLYYHLQQELGHEFIQNVAWREIFWADILQKQQERYVRGALVARDARSIWARKFVMSYLSDAASYRKTTDDKDTIYDQIHARVHHTISRLDELTGGRVPLVILAHSLGGQIMSNYIYDMGRKNPVLPANATYQSLTGFQKLKSLAAFTTFGCNIPVFAFSYAPEEIKPIRFPGTSIGADKRLKPWWNNYNDKHDILGMPLAGLSPGYEEMQARSELQDHWIKVGGVLSGRTPWSHVQYWTSRRFYVPVAQTLRKVMAIGSV